MADNPTSGQQDTPSNGDSTAARARDDYVLPFRTVRSDVMGRLVRLGPSVDAILKRHDYPEPVAIALGEALALTALLGAALKFEGRLILQTKSDGPLNFLVVNYQTPGLLRGYAGFDAEQVARYLQQSESDRTNRSAASLFGSGHLAMTIDPDGEMERHQGIVALDGQDLSAAALNYFRQSEQLPTFVRLAVARHYAPATGQTGSTSDAAADGSHGAEWSWRASGLLLQHVTAEGGRPATKQENEEDEPAMAGETDDDWVRVNFLANTVEDHELLDPILPPDRLLYRLFHEEGVRVVEPRPLKEKCRCSRRQVETFLRSFGSKELEDMREPDGAVSVTCEFCATNYRFDDGALA